MLSYDNTKNADVATDNKQPREQTKGQKGSEGKGGQRERKLFFLLGTFFLPRVDLNLICFLLWDLAYCHIRVPAHKQH